MRTSFCPEKNVARYSGENLEAVLEASLVNGGHRAEDHIVTHIMEDGTVRTRMQVCGREP
jgi:hypothetical protein